MKQIRQWINDHSDFVVYSLILLPNFLHSMYLPKMHENLWHTQNNYLFNFSLVHVWLIRRHSFARMFMQIHTFTKMISYKIKFKDRFISLVKYRPLRFVHIVILRVFWKFLAFSKFVVDNHVNIRSHSLQTRITRSLFILKIKRDEFIGAWAESGARSFVINASLEIRASE